MIPKLTHIRLLLILITCTCYGIDAKSQTVQDSLPMVIKKMTVGDWQWAETKTLDQGTVAVKNAQVCQCSKRFVLNKNGVMDYYENNVIVTSGPYEISQTADGNFFLRSPVYNDLFFMKDNGVLEIGTMGNGGSVYYYER